VRNESLNRKAPEKHNWIGKRGGRLGKTIPVHEKRRKGQEKSGRSDIKMLVETTQRPKKQKGMEKENPRKGRG